MSRKNKGKNGITCLQQFRDYYRAHGKDKDWEHPVLSDYITA